MSRIFDVATSYLASGFRLGAGMSASHARVRPEKLLELYEFEGCPFCRKVREGLSAFDLDAMIYPCPKGGRFREVVREKGGTLMFPFLVDPNTGASMYESQDILRYLAKTYGNGSVPLLLSLGPLTTLSSFFASAVRFGKGSRVRPSKAPGQPLELYSYEASPYSRIAREALASLQIPYVLHNVAGRGSGRPGFLERSGKIMVPYLVDPNTGEALFESAEIVRYLERTYGA